MGFRFRKRIKIAPGLHVNLSKSGTSLSVGERGATVNFGKRGSRITTGIPGTGLSYSKQINQRQRERNKFSPAAFVILILLAAWLLHFVAAH